MTNFFTVSFNKDEIGLVISFRKMYFCFVMQQIQALLLCCLLHFAESEPQTALGNQHGSTTMAQWMWM